MTKDGSFKKVVRRHAEGTGRRYTQALTDLEELNARMFHQPVGERLLSHLRDHYGIDGFAATKVSHHHDHVFRVDRSDGAPWIARAFSPARPRAGVEGDAAILRFLERHDYPAERLATDDAVSAFDDSTVLVTRFVPGGPLPMAVGDKGSEKFAIMGDLLGRLHTLPFDESVSRPGGASRDDPSREGSPRQDLMAALAFLDTVDTKVAPADRERFERLRDKVRSADDGQGLPEALLHGNLLHAPDHVILGERGPVAINWKAAGRGPRLADFAWLMWGTWRNTDWINLAVGAYRKHVELTADLRATSSPTLTLGGAKPGSREPATRVRMSTLLLSEVCNAAHGVQWTAIEKPPEHQAALRGTLFLSGRLVTRLGPVGPWGRDREGKWPI